MFAGTIYGTIAKDRLRPTKTIQWKKRNGEWAKVPFVRFHMWVPARTQTQNGDSQGRRPPQLVQVILPEQENRHRVFEYLSPGRQVLVSGDIAHRPGVGNSGVNGQARAYANPVCHAQQVQLLDSQPVSVANRVMDRMVEAGIIDETTAGDYKSKMETYLNGEADGAESPRLYLDETEGKAPPEDDTKDVTSDPNEPEFGNGLNNNDPI
jgi:single-stranded DNA-binding protein